MLKREALMESLSSNLNDFLKKTSKNLSLPDKKSLRDGLVGLLSAGQPIVWIKSGDTIPIFSISDTL